MSPYTADPTKVEQHAKRYQERVDVGRLAKSVKRAKGQVSALEGPNAEVHGSPERAPRGTGKRSKQPTVVTLAAESVLELARGRGDEPRGVAVARLRQAVHRDSRRRPRHAAVALATADALSLAPETLTVQQREALRRSALTMLDPYIAVGDERGVLTSFARTGLDRFAPLDEGPLAELLD